MWNKINKEQFIQKSIEKFGDIFDFSKTEYINYNTNITYTCKICNCEDDQRVGNFLKRGCINCRIKIKTTEEFIAKSKELHGDNFDYTLCNFVNMTTKVKLICNKCKNIVEVKPFDNLKRHTCKFCAGNKRFTTEDFISKSIKIHGDKFDYKNCVYINNHTPMEILCKEHNITFMQSAVNHYKGRGCDLCSNEAIGNLNRKPLEKFIQESKNKFRNKFEYSEVIYKNQITTIKLFCNDCQKWIFQRPIDHLLYGCVDCNELNATLRDRKKSYELFLKNAEIVHGDRYLYGNVNYINGDIKVSIVCKKHNFMFYQSPHYHIEGRNCPKCAQEQRILTSRRPRDEFINECIEIFDKQYDYSLVEYKGIHQPVTIKCNDCGNYFKLRPTQHLYYRMGCIHCKSNLSKGELSILKCLESLNRKYVNEFWTSECKHLLPLPFDFAVVDENENVKYLIEYQGEQHFRPVNFGGISDEEALENFNATIRNDSIKKEYCENNNIPILYISYKDFKNIKTIVNEFDSRFNDDD